MKVTLSLGLLGLVVLVSGLTEEEDNPIYYTNHWVVELDHGLTKREVDEIASELGYLNYGKVRVKGESAQP